METQKLNKIVCEIYRNNTNLLMELLKKAGVESFHVQSGRSVVLREKQGKFFLKDTTVLEEDPSDLFSFYVPEKDSDALMALMIKELKLSMPGNGSIYCEAIDLVSQSSVQFVSGIADEIRGHQAAGIASKLVGIRCIVQRGEGNQIVRSALDMGSTVPSVTFGAGTGLRDKLGLLRITIPAEKEIATLVVSENDSEELMNVLIDAGKLDFPGKGFIYVYPVEKGMMNSKIFRGKQKYAASMEQVIFAIDGLKGNIEWRKRSAGALHEYGKNRKFLQDLTDLTFICNEGRAADIVKDAMSKGASGATISQLKFGHLNEAEDSPVSRAREMANMIIGSAQIKTLLESLKESGLFDAATCGIVEMKPVPKACTYLG